jgi:undecaprenyl diphosphate synthase
MKIEQQRGKAERDKVPRHVAIIMDGNGRWARERGWRRSKGHEEGAESVRAVMRAAWDAGVKYLTVYAFSVENWVRPKAEIAVLMRLLVRFLKKEEAELHENEIRLRAMGRLSDLPVDVQRELNRVIESTAKHDRAHLILSLSYGARTEIAYAARELAREVKQGTLSLDDIDEKAVGTHLYLPDVPDPDLLIRTSGERRLSNFMLWQLSYAEFYFTETYWPDFREAQLKEALAEYARRHRRFGDVE